MEILIIIYTFIGILISIKNMIKKVNKYQVTEFNFITVLLMLLIIVAWLPYLIILYLTSNKF